MRQLYLLLKAGPLTPITGFLMVILLGAFITITYQPAFAAEPPANGMNQSESQSSSVVPGPCGKGDDPVLCVGVPISPIPNQLGCTTGQQCSLLTQNKTCGEALSGKKCTTQPIATGSTQCECICKK
jgi:hypothetical protein